MVTLVLLKDFEPVHGFAFMFSNTKNVLFMKEFFFDFTWDFCCDIILEHYVKTTFFK